MFIFEASFDKSPIRRRKTIKTMANLTEIKNLIRSGAKWNGKIYTQFYSGLIKFSIYLNGEKIEIDQVYHRFAERRKQELESELKNI